MTERRRAKFREDVHAHVAANTLVVVWSESGLELLEGRLDASLIPLLRSSLDLDEIITHAEETFDTLDIVYTLERYQALGWLGPETRRDPPLQEVQSGGFTVVVASDYLASGLEERNAEALAAGRAWMLVRPGETTAWIGPVFREGSPCWRCMAERMRAVRSAWDVPERARLPSSASSVETAIGLGMRMREQVEGCIVTVDLTTMRERRHEVVRRPGCSACGGRPVRAPADLEVHVSPLIGIVHSVARIGGDDETAVAAARHNFRLSRARHPRRSFGASPDAALREALERYSGIARGDEPCLRATFRELGADAIDPRTCLLISDAQYASREAWNRTMPASLRLPEPFDENAPIDWVEARSLTHGRTRHVAAAFCYYGLADAFCRADSNGSAAGASFDDAVRRGLLELVERDAVAIWWYGRERRPGVALQTPFAASIARAHEARGRRFWVLDLTTDLRIPVFAAVSHSPANRSFLFGFGAHPDPAAAMDHALTELSQGLALRPGGSAHFGEIADPSFLEPHGSQPLCEANVTECIELLRAHDLEVMVVDQTREDVGLPVVKVIVPGLRPFHARFAPGRLYDVAPRLGWRAHALREDELNPAHLMV